MTADLSHFVRHLDGGTARLELAVDGITCAAASCASNAAPGSTSKNPPRFPAAAFALLNASSVLATPHEETRNRRRGRLSRLAQASACSWAR